MKTKTDQIMENIAAWDETQEGKAFRDANDIRNPPGINDDPACVERSLYCSKSSTTVWTNHGEPQPLDDKHFGVAIETEAETEATRQAETDRTWWTYWQYNDEIKRLTAQRDELLATLRDIRDACFDTSIGIETNRIGRIYSVAKSAVELIQGTPTPPYDLGKRCSICGERILNTFKVLTCQKCRHNQRSVIANASK